MNKKGFTLVELLAVIALLAILTMLAVPNVISTINNNRKNTFLLDAKRMIARAEYLISVNKDDRDNVLNGTSVTYSLETLNEKGEFSKDPDGGSYEAISSVVVTKSGNKFNYCIKLIGSKRKIEGTGGICINNTDLTGIGIVKDR